MCYGKLRRQSSKTVLVVKNGWNRLSGTVEIGRKLLVKFYDLQWLCSILHKQVGEDRQVLELADCDRTLCEIEINTLLTAAKKDEEDLEHVLRDPQGDYFCRVWGCPTEPTCMRSLATQLLKKLRFQSEFQAWPATQKKNYHDWLYKSTVDVSAWPSVLSVNIHNLKAGKLLGQGATGIVREAEWLKEPYAMKISRYGHQEIFKNEIAALSELRNPSVGAFKARMQSGKRPQLPPNCPNYLSGLIQQCWDGSAVNRPDFQTICTELRCIKGCLLTGMVFHHCILNIQVNSVLVANVTCTMMPCMH
ncbi:unnamed protein product [Sphagnum tenellum]